jgi:hypothetical protein
MMDSYLKDAFIPALHRAAVPMTGVFKPIETDTAYGKLIYMTTYSDMKSHDVHWEAFRAHRE